MMDRDANSEQWHLKEEGWSVRLFLITQPSTDAR